MRRDWCDSDVFGSGSGRSFVSGGLARTSTRWPSITPFQIGSVHAFSRRFRQIALSLKLCSSVGR